MRPDVTAVSSRRLLALLTLALAACAPPEADYALSERARTAPAPVLAPTASFSGPLQGGIETAARLGAETDALAARAADLRARGAALSAADVVAPDMRDRLETAAGAREIGPAP